MSHEAGDWVAKDFSEINAADNFGHVDLFDFLHEERPGYSTSASAR
jgi:hypothetical protein